MIDVLKPTRTTTHRDHGLWARTLGPGWSFSITEREYPRALFVHGVSEPADKPWVMMDTLTGLIALRINEGWTLVSADATSAALTR